MSSWSDNRSREERPSIEKLRSELAAVNGILLLLSRDDDLHEDLSDSEVRAAMLHWTGEKRLSPDEALRFQDNYRVMSVLKKIQTLQAACRALGIPIPMDHLVQRRPELSKDLLTSRFRGAVESKVSSTPGSQEDVLSGNSSRTTSGGKSEKKQNESTSGGVCTTESVSPSSWTLVLISGVAMMVVAYLVSMYMFKIKNIQ